MKFVENLRVFGQRPFDWFWRTLPRCVLGPWPRAFLSLASDFVCVLSLELCVLDSIFAKRPQKCARKKYACRVKAALQFNLTPTILFFRLCYSDHSLMNNLLKLRRNRTLINEKL